jgi:hypothetical protein
VVFGGYLGYWDCGVKYIVPQIIYNIIIWRAPGPYGASPTQPYKCGQNVKVKVNVKTNAVLILTLTF